MPPDGRSRGPFLAASAVLAIALAIGAPAGAKTPFDGAWAVTIMTENGACDPAYQRRDDVCPNVRGSARHGSPLCCCAGSA